MYIFRRKNLRKGHLGRKDKSLFSGPRAHCGQETFFFFFFFFFWLKLDLNFGAGSLVAAKSTAMHKSFSPPSNSSQSPGDPRDQGGPKDRATGDEFKKGKKEQSTYLPQPHPKCFARILSSVI